MPPQILTSQYQYETGGLHHLLEKLPVTKYTGNLSIITRMEQSSRSRLLIWHDGLIVYGGVNSPESLVKTLVMKFKPGWADSVMGFMTKKVRDRTSLQERLEMLVKLHVLEWQQVRDFVRERIVWTLEQAINHAGQANLEAPMMFDLVYDGNLAKNAHEFDLSQLLQAVINRQVQWEALAPIIPSMEAIPTQAIKLELIPDIQVRNHVNTWVNGKYSLVDIAAKLDRDPLQIAEIYSNWSQKSWITLVEPNVKQSKQLPVILSVDDSPIVQTTIKRVLSSQYEVVQADKALDALGILNQQSDRVSLIILDLTMPDIDGLQLCRTIRSIPKFKDLPIIMLTARDGFFDKLKGQMAGSDRYLTKPFDSEKLLEIVREYV